MNSRITKYFFGYRKVNGKVFPFTWAEDDGVITGGKGKTIQEHTISFDEFYHPNLSALSVKFPLLPGSDKPDE